ncbi:MAG: hypothetical protein KME22_07795 [Hassallia sp. WJT32-NPBG1]|jgi:hypothetical protein|nr:hypothetical protein [Hassallia sp. WJT32-NPBG1]
MHEFIKDLLRKNFTIKTIKSRCLKKGWDITDEEIEVIKNNLNLELEIERVNKDKNIKKGKAIIPLFTQENTYFDFAKRVGVNTEYTNINELISIVQKLTADIFIRQSLCLLRALELQSEGHFIDLDILFKGYDIALKGLCKAWGISNLIDVNAAFQCLESKGYLNTNHALSQIPQIHESN